MTEKRISSAKQFNVFPSSGWGVSQTVEYGFAQDLVSSLVIGQIISHVHTIQPNGAL